MLFFDKDVRHATHFQVMEVHAKDLLTAAEDGDLLTVKRLIEKGAAVEQMNELGWTALLHAAYRGHLDMVQWLVHEGGANIAHADLQYGRTALLHATFRRRYAIVHWLLTEGGESVSDALWLELQPKPGEKKPVPQAILRFMLLERQCPEPAATNFKQNTECHYRFMSTNMMFAYGERLRVRRPGWLLMKSTIVTEIISHMPESLVSIMLAYSAPSTEETWSEELRVAYHKQKRSAPITPRPRNPERATRQKR